jgi:hypothetical protein
MDEGERIELLTQTTSHYNRYISQADQKASILISGHLAFVGLLLNSPLFEPQAYCSYLPIFISGATIFAATYVIFPRIRDENRESPELGNLSWVGAANKSREEYVNNILSTEREASVKSLVKSNLALAKVLDKKYRWLRISMIGSLVSLVTTLAILL